MMKKVFQGEVIKTEDFEYDFIEIKGPETAILHKTPFFIVPTSKKAYEYLIVNYYKIEIYENHLLQYDEFKSKLEVEDKTIINSKKINCIKSEIFSVDTPVEFQEFYKDKAKFLALKVKTAGEFKITMEDGTIIKEGSFYKVFGQGCYIFEQNLSKDSYTFQPNRNDDHHTFKHNKNNQLTSHENDLKILYKFSGFDYSAV